MDSRLSPLDLADPPEQWDSIEQRIPRQSLPPGPSTSHRIAIAAIALVVATAGILFAIRALSPMERPVGPSVSTEPATLTYMDPSGWTATYPSSWMAKRIPVTEDGLGTGVIFSPRPAPIGPRTPVSLTITHPLHGPQAMVPSRWPHRLPLRLADFQPEPGSGSSLVLPFREGDTLYFARATLLLATPQEMTDMQLLISSIRFPEAMVEQTPRGWTELGPASRFPPGMGTPWYANGSIGTVYVMRGLASTYALDIPPLTYQPRRCAESLDERWDPDRRQIWIRCPTGSDVRYRVDGSPLPGNPAGLRATIPAYRIYVTADGTLFLAPTPMSRPHEERAWSG